MLPSYDLAQVKLDILDSNMRSTVLSVLLLAFGAKTAFSDDATALTEPESKDNSGECQCYLVSGKDAGYFQYYRYWVRSSTRITLNADSFSGLQVYPR